MTAQNQVTKDFVETGERHPSRRPTVKFDDRPSRRSDFFWFADELGTSVALSVQLRDSGGRAFVVRWRYVNLRPSRTSFIRFREREAGIRLATATTLVANRDPVLLAEDYALLDILSGGRLKLIAGGSFFPDPTSCSINRRRARPRASANLDLLIRLWTEESVTWSGEFRPPLNEVTVQPRLLQARPRYG